MTRWDFNMGFYGLPYPQKKGVIFLEGKFMLNLILDLSNEELGLGFDDFLHLDKA